VTLFDHHQNKTRKLGNSNIGTKYLRLYSRIDLRPCCQTWTSSGSNPRPPPTCYPRSAFSQFLRKFTSSNHILVPRESAPFAENGAKPRFRRHTYGPICCSGFLPEAPRSPYNGVGYCDRVDHSSTSQSNPITAVQ
jgi:hypothetical protein